MDITDRNHAGVDVPPFSYTGIAHTFRNSPFNEYPYAMARLRWFTTSIGPGWSDESALLHKVAAANGHFTYLQVSDAGLVDHLLDVIHKDRTGTAREARELGPHEPGLGRWINEDDFNERRWLHLPVGADREALFELISGRLSSEHTDDAVFDEVYLYPPEYGATPEQSVRHAFRIFGHTGVAPDARDSPGPRGIHLGEAVEATLDEVARSRQRLTVQH